MKEKQNLHHYHHGHHWIKWACLSGFAVIFVAFVGVLLAHDAITGFQPGILSALGFGPNNPRAEFAQEFSGSHNANVDFDDLIRVFPDSIHGLWESNNDSLAQILSSKAALQDLRDTIGVNTLAIPVLFRVLPDGSYTVEDSQLTEDLIIAAKQTGMSVVLTLRVSDDTAFASLSSAEFFDAIHDAALEWAVKAERYKVEYFVPLYNAADVVTDAGTTQKIISDWHESAATELREVFNGKLVAHFGTLRADFTVPSYDYIGLNIDSNFLGAEVFRDAVVRDYELAAQVSAQSGNIPWLVMSARFPNASYGDGDGGQGALSQADYFRIALEEYGNFSGTVRPAGFCFMGYFNPEYAVRGSDAAQVLAEYFTRI